MTEPERSLSPLRYLALEELRVLVVGGIPIGVLVAGLGSRLAMLLLRVTSPESVVGMTSDDGFTIGRFTVGGTYSLLALGAIVGVIGAGAYQLVAPWLIGPTWFRRLTTGLASAVVVGSMVVHADGIDFRILRPTWLAVSLFVALPGVFGALIGMTVDAVKKPSSWTVQGRRRWLIPVIIVGCFPVTAPILFLALTVASFWLLADGASRSQRWRTIPLYALSARGIWLLIAIAGLVGLVNDITALT